MPYDVPASSTLGRIFFPQHKSFDAIRQDRQAVGDAEVLPALEGYAVDRLCKTAQREVGTLDPAKLESWRRQRRDAVNAFPELDARIADADRAFATIADVTARKDAQAGSLGRLIGVEHPDDVSRIIGGMSTGMMPWRKSAVSASHGR